MLVIPVFLLAFALISIPVMAAPATKIEGVTLTVAAPPPVMDPGYPRVVGHTVLHGRGTDDGTVTLIIPGYPLPEGIWESTWSSKVKLSNYPLPDPEATIVINGKVTLTFIGEGTTGTFTGTTHRKIMGWPPGSSSIMEDHMVLHGTGDFKGQTLKLSCEPVLPPVIEGCLIIPK